MPEMKARLLIVDDEPSIRTSLSLALTEIGYLMRSAADGFSALTMIRQELPDILLSDLNMPGMSGFELLSVVRRRFPAIKSIAMSGAFCGDEVPSGVAADAFYQKGSSISSLVRILDTLPQLDRALLKQTDPSKPIWIQGIEKGPSGDLYVTIPCPECLRTFTVLLDSPTHFQRETNCIYCGSPIHYAVVRSADQMPMQAIQQESDAALRAPRGTQRISY